MIIEASREGLTLERLRPEDADPYATLLLDNRAHLTRWGNHEDELATTAPEYARQFGVEGPALTFGIHAGAWRSSIVWDSSVRRPSRTTAATTLTGRRQRMQRPLSSADEQEGASTHQQSGPLSGA